MNEFKTMKFVRETRDKIYEETRNKTKEKIRKYYKEKGRWLNSFMGNNTSIKMHCVGKVK